jgi:hypothetical protein
MMRQTVEMFTPWRSATILIGSSLDHHWRRMVVARSPSVSFLGSGKSALWVTTVPDGSAW